MTCAENRRLPLAPICGPAWWGRRPAARLVVTAVLLPLAAVVQAREELETDRDSFTFAPTTAGPGVSILEASYSFIENRPGPAAHSFPEVLLRRGFGERVEARLGFNYEAGGPGTVSGSEFGGEDIETEDESRVLYGAKIETTGQDGWLPGGGGWRMICGKYISGLPGAGRNRHHRPVSPRRCMPHDHAVFR